MRMRLIALTSAVALTVGTAEAVARTPETYPVPDTATIAIDGHGYGHGHGMSQWGAQGGALEGKSWQDIASFYYPGTAVASQQGKVSVHLTGDTTPNVVVLARDGLRMRRVGSDRWWQPTKPAAKRWRITAVPGFRSQISYLTSSWHVFRTVSGEAEFNAHGRPITLLTPIGRMAYRGTLRSASTTTSGRPRVTVNILPLDSYLKGVVASEMPSYWEPAALQAQAVAARTYAAFERQQPLSRAYQICDTTSCQVYRGYTGEVASTNAAVAATAGKILTWQGQPAFTQFSSSSGGWTSAGSQPYLPAQPDPWDSAPEMKNYQHSWQVTVTDAKVEKLFPAVGNLQAITVDSRDGNGEWGGRILQITLVGDKKTVSVSGDDFRFRLGLKSTWLNFTVTAGRR